MSSLQDLINCLLVFYFARAIIVILVLLHSVKTALKNVIVHGMSISTYVTLQCLCSSLRKDGKNWQPR